MNLQTTNTYVIIYEGHGLRGQYTKQLFTDRMDAQKVMDQYVGFFELDCITLENYLDELR